MSETKPHAELRITVESHSGLPSMKYGIIEITGCHECLVANITAHLLHNPKFKEVINKAIKSANEIKGRTQN